MIIYMDSDSNEENSENEGEDQKLEKGPDVAIELKVESNQHTLGSCQLCT